MNEIDFRTHRTVIYAEEFIFMRSLLGTNSAIRRVADAYNIDPGTVIRALHRRGIECPTPSWIRNYSKNLEVV